MGHVWLLEQKTSVHFQVAALARNGFKHEREVVTGAPLVRERRKMPLRSPPKATVVLLRGTDPAATPPCHNPHNNPDGLGDENKGCLSKTERAHRREVECVAMERLLALQWAILDRQFQYHIRLVGHFREVGPAAALRMWRTQTNKDGKRLSQFERDALKERYCELFGTWPD
jgi:hypothetical protein